MLRWRLLLACGLGARARPDAVHLRADPGGPLPAHQRRRADRLHDDHSTCPARWTKSPSTGLMDNINRVQYGKPDVSDRQAPFRHRSGCIGSTSSGSGCATCTAEHPGIQNMLAAIFLILGLFGGYAHWRYDRRSFWFFGPLIFTVTLCADRLPELQVRILGVAGAGGQRRPRGPRSRLLLPVELLGLERVGRARLCVPVGDPLPRSSAPRWSVRHARRQSTRRKRSWLFASPLLRPGVHSTVRQLAGGVARRSDGHARFREDLLELRRALRRARDGR